MLRKIINWLGKDYNDYELQVQLPKNEEAKFILKVDTLCIGTLFCEKGDWYFKYAEDFKNHSDEYNLIVGFPDLNKTYKSNSLWPFFQIRIPGLKQPAIQEILKNEKGISTIKKDLFDLSEFMKQSPYKLQSSIECSSGSQTNHVCSNKLC